MRGGNMFKALDLAVYISDKYYKRYGLEISGIKLQKSLYFLFAYWGGFIRKSKNNKDSVEQDLSSYNERLFDDEIQAWTYGPVVPSVYHGIDRYRKINEANSDRIENIISCQYNGYVKKFIDDLLNDIFVLSDFKLVDISHEDKSWENNYDYNAEFHNEVITPEEIISEYASK